MHPRPSDAAPALPAYALALVLLGALTAVGGLVVGQMRMAPGTPLSAGAEAAMASPNNARAPSGHSAAVAIQAESGPGWGTLNTPQKLALYPLAERWAHISEAQKRRWLALAANFANLPEEEQAKFHARMTDWANLSAQQRNQARLNFAVTNRLAPDDKRAQWEAYQALSEAERRALAAQAAPRPKGAATALRPVPAAKLAQVPAATKATEANPGRPNAPKISPALVNNTPRMVVPVPVATPPAAPAPQAASSAAVETAPVATPSAVPATLPPLGASAPEDAAPPAPPASADNPNLYLQ